MRVFPDFLKLFLSVCLEAAASSPRKKKMAFIWNFIYIYVYDKTMITPEA